MTAFDFDAFAAQEREKLVRQGILPPKPATPMQRIALRQQQEEAEQRTRDAADDMLAVLQSVSQHDVPPPVWERIHAAIAKATGATP